MRISFGTQNYSKDDLWHEWFAWRPVLIYDWYRLKGFIVSIHKRSKRQFTTVWLEKVWRKYDRGWIYKRWEDQK